MGLTIKTTQELDEAANFIFFSVTKQLSLGKHVLLFLAGGSAVLLAVRISNLFKNFKNKNLTITLTDERYVPNDHFNSNYFQFLDNGFNVGNAKFIPVLTGDDLSTTTSKWDDNLKRELKIAQYKMGLFGIGVDGHTAGILPESSALNSLNLVSSYETPIFSRITITPKVIEQLDEAIVWAQGEGKWGVLKDLENDIDFNKQPAQLLKKVPLLTIFTDYKKE